MGAIKKFIHSYKWAILSGVLIGTSYIPFPAWASLFFLAPLWYSWTQNPKPRYVFFSGWFTQFILTLIGFHWISHTAVEYGHLPKALGILIMLLFCAHANLQYAVAGWLWSRLFAKDTRSFSSLIALALFTFIFETIWPQIFPWNAGYTLFWSKFPIYQLADVIGFQGLSLLVYLSNAVVVNGILTKQIRSAVFKLVVVFVGLNILGFFWVKRWPEADQNLKVTIVQANIGNFEKYMAQANADFRAPIVEKFFSMTTSSFSTFGKPDMVLWPETAFPSNLHKSALQSPYPLRLMDFVRQMGIPLFTGGYTEIPNGPYFNSIYLFDSTAQIKGVYHKSHLLAFGEYFPLSDYFPFLKKLMDEISDFGRGDGPMVLDYGQAKMGPQVCYEGLFPDFSRGLSNEGAEIFVNVTNDSWFGHNFESRQHLYMTLARAVEFRRPLIRSTNTGISAVVTAQGEVILEGPQEQEWVGQASVPYLKAPRETIYAKYGEVAVLPVALLICLAIFLSYVRHTRLDRNSSPN